jgi:hypothetical protein
MKNVTVCNCRRFGEEAYTDDTLHDVTAQKKTLRILHNSSNF